MPKDQTQTGAIVEVLCDEGVLSTQQIRFAQRISEKLTDSKPLLGVLKELEMRLEDTMQLSG